MSCRKGHQPLSKVRGAGVKGGVLVSSGSHDYLVRTGWLKQQKFVFSQFWKLATQD